MTFESITRSTFWLTASAVLIVAVILLYNRTSPEPGIKPGSLVANSLAAIEIGQLSESNLVDMANQYRTNNPWLAVSNEKIYAGLYDRYWSADYFLPGQKNEAGLLFGTGFGAYYHYTIFDRFTIGGVLIIDAEKNFGAFGTAGYKW